MLRSLFLAACILAAITSFGQYTKTPLFGHVQPYEPKYKATAVAKSVKVSIDSSNQTMNTIRLVGATGYEFGSTAVAGLGAGWTHLAWNATSKVYETQYAAGVLFWMTGTRVYDSTATGIKLKPAFGVGPFVSIPVLKVLNTPFQVAYVYNWTIRKFEPIIGLNFIWK